MALDKHEHTEAQDKIEFIEILDPHGQEFEDGYKFYEEAFPPGERETKENMRRWIERKAKGELVPDDIHMMIAKQNGKTIGFSSCHYIDAIRSGFLGYIVIDPTLRSGGIGSNFYAAVRSGIETNVQRAHPQEKPRGMFMELDKESDEDDNTYRRFRFWNKNDVRPLNMHWQYPDLGNGAPPADMYLACAPLDGNDTYSLQEMQDVATAIYKSVYEKEKDDPDLQKVLENIRRIGTDTRSKIERLLILKQD